MTDSEMLSQILDKVTGLESDMKEINDRLDGIDIRLDGIDTRLDKVEGRLDKVEGRLDKADNEFDKLNSKISSLQVGQIELRKELKEVNIKVSDTYNLALDTWGRSVENRRLIETVN